MDLLRYLGKEIPFKKSKIPEDLLRYLEKQIPFIIIMDPGRRIIIQDDYGSWVSIEIFREGNSLQGDHGPWKSIEIV